MYLSSSLRGELTIVLLIIFCLHPRLQAIFYTLVFTVFCLSYRNSVNLKLMLPWRTKISLVNLEKSKLTVPKDEGLVLDKCPTIASSGPSAEDVC